MTHPGVPGYPPRIGRGPLSETVGRSSSGEPAVTRAHVHSNLNDGHAARLEAVATLPGVQEALAKSPTIPPLAGADAPSLSATATFVGTLLTAAGALAWLVLPRVL